MSLMLINPYRFVSTGGLFSGTVYQSNFEGTDATNISGTGIDDSSYDHTHSFGGIRGVEYSTTEAKFGLASANSDGGSSSYLQVATQGDEFKFGTGDFSVEFFILQDAADAGFIMGQWNNGANRRAWTIVMESNGALEFFFTASGSTSTSAFGSGTAAGTLTQNGTWQHVAICRVSGVMSFYVDGTRLQTATVTTDLFDVADDFVMFNAGDGQYNQPWAGYLDGVRIVKGNSPYDPTSASLTVPTSYYS